MIKHLHRPILLIFILTAVCLQYANAQLLPNISSHIKSITAQEFNKRILVSWTTEAGYYCSDIHILYGDDSTNLGTIGRYPGICGDATEKSYHFWIDSVILNKPSYVKIWVDLLGFSKIVSLTIYGNNNQNLFIFPHPANQNSTIVFPENTHLQENKLFIYTLEGQEIYNTTITESSMAISSFNLPTGIYIYQFFIENRIPVVSKIHIVE